MIIVRDGSEGWEIVEESSLEPPEYVASGSSKEDLVFWLSANEHCPLEISSDDLLWLLMG